ASSSAPTVRRPFVSRSSLPPGGTAHARCSAMRPRASDAVTRSGAALRIVPAVAASHLRAASNSAVLEGLRMTPPCAALPRSRRRSLSRQLHHCLFGRHQLTRTVGAALHLDLSFGEAAWTNHHLPRHADQVG